MSDSPSGGARDTVIDIQVERWSAEDATDGSRIEPKTPFDDDDGEVVELTELDLLSIEDLDAGNEGPTPAGPPPFAADEPTDRTPIGPAQAAAAGPAGGDGDGTEPLSDDEDTRPTATPAA